MLYPYLIAVGVTTVLTSVWCAVQIARRWTFPEASPETDLLAGRAGCCACPKSEGCEITSESELWSET